MSTPRALRSRARAANAATTSPSSSGSAPASTSAPTSTTSSAPASTPEVDGLERLVRWAEAAGYLPPSEAATLRTKMDVARVSAGAAGRRSMRWVLETQRTLVDKARVDLTMDKAGFSFGFFSVAYQTRLLLVLLFFLASGWLNALSSCAAGWRTPRIQLLDVKGNVVPGQTLPDLGHDLVGWLGGAVLPATWMTAEGAVAWEQGPDTFVNIFVSVWRGSVGEWESGGVGEWGLACECRQCLGVLCRFRADILMCALSCALTHATRTATHTHRQPHTHTHTHTFPCTHPLPLLFS